MMRLKSFLLPFILLFLVPPLLAGVIKENKSSVTFKGFGEFRTHSRVTIDKLTKLEDDQKSFKGRNFLGNITAKLILRPGHTGTLTDLQQMKAFELNHDKKEYRELPIEKLKLDQTEGGEAPEEQEMEYEQSDQDSSDVRIIRQVFRVTDTGQEKNINNFPCNLFTILWVTEWENVNTMERGTDSLFTEVWTTKTTAEMEQARQQEMEFSRVYLEKIGIDLDQEQYDMLGMNWLNMFRALSQSRNENERFEDKSWVEEMQKIEGYPVLIDGNYFAIRPQQKQQQPAEAEETTDVRDVKKMFGGFLKKAIKKKDKPKKKGPEAAFSYRTELVNLQVREVGPLAVPADYKKID